MNAQITSKSAEDDKHRALMGCIAPEDLAGDVDRLIYGIVAPYLDDSNPLMQKDELRGECFAKLARLIDGGHLLNCPTRAKAFGFIKTAMKNHVLSLVQKLAFAEKRTGIKNPPRNVESKASDDTRQNKLTKLSLDDAECPFQVGCADPNFCRLEFLEELDFNLSPEERD